MRAWAAALGVLLLFVLAMFALPALIGLVSKRALILRLALFILGVAAAVIVLVLLLRRAKSRPAAPLDGTHDIDLAFAGAQSRLRASGAGESRLDRLPSVLVMGPVGATKSSIVTRSGIDAELLHGEVYRGDAVLPTDPANIWYSQGTVLVEAGGRLLDDVERWSRLTAHLRASGLAAAIGRGRQAPRAVVVCVPCDELAKPGAAEAMPALARTLRARLSELSQHLGIRLPVYVVFTRADRLPGFADYVRNFTTDEAQQVLGATLPLMASGHAGWAEAQARRLQSALRRITQSLGTARLDVLEREVDEAPRAAAYEFPRELSKIGDLAVQFLVDVCRPSQLGVNPFLRGFYFVGVRPVVLRDAAMEAPVARLSAAPESGATGVFNPGAAFGQAAAAAKIGGGRRAPQWTFLPRLFPDVVFADATALSLTAGGTRVDLLRRGLIAAAAAAIVIIATGMSVSFGRNRALALESVEATTKARDIGGVAGVIGQADLERLDTLRQRAERVLDYERGGRPLSFGWGLYVGHDLAPLLRRAYFERFDRALWSDTHARLIDYLHGLPAQPNEDSDFGAVQDALAAALLTSTEYRRATPEMLVPALMSHSRDLGSDTARTIAQREYTFFASELPFGNPLPATLDPQLVGSSQRFLRAFGNEAYYRALVYEGNRAAPAVHFTPLGGVRNDVVVPGAFTHDGRQAVEAELDSIDQLFNRYQWIYGNQPPADKPRRDDLRRAYLAEYIRRWQNYLAGGAVEPFTSPADASVKLSVLSAGTSPLFAMLTVASQQTPTDTVTELGKAFMPLHAVVPSTVDPRANTAAARGYATALAALGTQLNLVADASGTARAQAMTAATTAVSDLDREIATLAATFSMTGDAAVTANELKRLLAQPSGYARSLLAVLPIADLNAAGRSFCASYDAVTSKFPFSARAAADATPDEVRAVFAKDDGSLAAFYKNQQLQTYITPQGAPQAGSKVNPAFAHFFARAVDVTTALYHNGQLAASFEFRPTIPAGATAVVLNVDGQQLTFTPQSPAGREVDWTAAGSHSARLAVVYGTSRVEVASGTGVWAPFHLMRDSNWRLNGSSYDVDWSIPGRNATLAARVNVEAGAAPVFQPGYLGRAASCVSQIVN